MSTSITATTSTTITTTRTLRVCCAQAARPTPSRKHSLRIVLPPTSAGTAVITYTWPEDRVSYHGPRKDNLPRRKVKKSCNNAKVQGCAERGEEGRAD